MELKFQIQGQGQDILLLHGWGGSISSLEPLAQALIKKGYRCINIEWPGAGTSQPPKVPLQLEDYADLLVKVITQLDLTDPIALGHSFGGKVALKTVLKYPDLISKLILVDASGIKPHNDLKKKVFKSISNGVKKLPVINKLGEGVKYAYYRFLVREMDYYKAGPMRDTFKNIIAQDLDQELERIALPTLIIWGDQDKITPLWMGQRLNSLIKGSTLRIVEGRGHGLPLVAAQKVSELVFEYLHN